MLHRSGGPGVARRGLGAERCPRSSAAGRLLLGTGEGDLYRCGNAELGTGKGGSVVPAKRLSIITENRIFYYCYCNYIIIIIIIERGTVALAEACSARILQVIPLALAMTLGILRFREFREFGSTVFGKKGKLSG